jgi:DNA-binding beta-propeller fold protein YncE
MDVRLNKIKIAPATLLLLSLCFFSSAQELSQVAFRIADSELIPEGIAYDPQARVFYVGSTYKRKIVSVDKKGVARDFTGEAQEGLMGVLGMKVDTKRRLLWAVSSNAGGAMPGKELDRNCLGCSAVFKYDLRRGRLIKKYVLHNKPNVHFLNDLTINSSGDAFITDTITGDIYLISRTKDELELLVNLGQKAFPNGIDLSDDEKQLFVAAAGGVQVVNLLDKKSRTLKLPDVVSPLVIDGLYFYKGSLIAIQPFADQRKLVRYFLDKEANVVTRFEVIESEHPLFNQPTTGAIVDKDFYYIANSQLQLFRRIYKPDATYDKGQLLDVIVLRERL